MLHRVVRFVGWLQEMINLRRSRAYLSKLKLSEFLRQQITFNDDRRRQVEKDAEECLDFWKKIKPVGSNDWDMSSPLTTFLLHSDNQ